MMVMMNTKIARLTFVGLVWLTVAAATQTTTTTTTTTEGHVGVAASIVGEDVPDVLTDKTLYPFDRFVKEYGRTYDSDEEFHHRQRVFEANLEKIVRHNRREGGSSYTLGVNHFMDLEPHEMPMGYDKTHHYIRTTNPTETLATERRLVEELPFEMEDVSKLPTSVDWRTEGIVSPVKDQGGCGSCWAFASTAALESHVALQTGLLYSLSTQELVSCVPNPHKCGGTGGCGGSTSQLAYDFLSTKGGVVEEDAFGYQSYHGASIDCAVEDKDTGVVRGAVAKIDGYAETPLNDYKAVMNAVAKHGPVVVSVAAVPWSYYSGGVFDPDEDDEPSKTVDGNDDASTGNVSSMKNDIDHAVVLVGYGTDEKTGLDYWLVRNSWSPKWGERGYIRLKRQDPSTLDNPDDDCAMDTTPLDGDGCEEDEDGNPITPDPIKICGTSGVYYQAVMPTGGSLV